jgi:hypothetical protein
MLNVNKLDDMNSDERHIYTLRIYMKSGNLIVLPHMLDYHWRSDLTGSKRLVIKWSDKARLKPAVPTFDLDQIEAITWESEGFQPMAWLRFLFIGWWAKKPA